MRLGALVREAWVSTRTRLVPALMVAVLCASVCATTLMTVGRTASAEAEIEASMELAGSRELVVSDRLGAGQLSPVIVRAVSALEPVERAVGLTAARDVRSGHLADGGRPVPAWGVVGGIESVGVVTSGRAPGPGEALVSQSAMDALGLDEPVGFVVDGDREYAVVGAFSAREPFAELASGVVLAFPDAPARDLHVIAHDTRAVPVVQRITLSLVAPPAPGDVVVRSAASLAALQQEVMGGLGVYGRQLVVLVLGAGAVLAGVVTLADVLLRRADLGRRRALGATRKALVALVILRVLFAALAGVVVGTVASLVVLRTWDVDVPAQFALGTAVLALLAALVAAVGPAVVAATRDPVSILRTP